jgi:hypothetical protein
MREPPGRAQLYVKGKLVGQADLTVTVPLALGIGRGLTVGRNLGAPVSNRYTTTPFEFTGKIFKVTALVSGKMIQDTEEDRMRAPVGLNSSVNMPIRFS